MTNTTTCPHSIRRLSIKLIPTNRPNQAFYPKFIPQIRENCNVCDKFFRFVPQTQDVIDLFNKKANSYPVLLSETKVPEIKGQEKMPW